MNTFKIIGAEIQDKLGTIINIVTEENITINSKLSINYENKEHYFQIISIRVISDENRIYLQAKEVGYWGSKFDRKKDFDLRNILGLEVNLIIDKDKLDKIDRESCYC